MFKFIGRHRFEISCVKKVTTFLAAILAQPCQNDKCSKTDKSDISKTAPVVDVPLQKTKTHEKGAGNWQFFKRLTLVWTSFFNLAVKAQWIRQHLPSSISCGLRFKSQAHHIRKFLIFLFYCIETTY